METVRSIITALALLYMFVCCEKEEIYSEQTTPREEETTGEYSSNDIPDGYFEAVFSPEPDRESRAAVSGLDPRIRSVRYVIYKSTGEFVKEKTVLETTDNTPRWPLGVLRDTLPRGEYSAVFLANMDKTLFPVKRMGGTVYEEILTNYRTVRANARINLPASEFTDNSEFYFASISFSDTSPRPYVLLQRIISMLNLRRVFIDAQTALNSLTGNIVAQTGYRNSIKTAVQGALPGTLKKAMDMGVAGNAIYATVGGLDAAVNMAAGALVQPVADQMYALLLKQLVNEIGKTLSGNATQDGALGILGSLLNPWKGNDVAYAIVTIRDFPKALNLDLNVTDIYPGDHRFKYRFTATPGSTNSEKDILIRGFHGMFNIRDIHVAGPEEDKGGINGDGNQILDGTFVNITDPIQTQVETNYRYRTEYSFASLELKSYAMQTDGAHSLTLSIQLSEVANLDGILGGIPLLGPILGSTIRVKIGYSTMSVPINLPLLGIDNLKLSGSWKTPPEKY